MIVPDLSSSFKNISTRWNRGTLLTECKMLYAGLNNPVCVCVCVCERERERGKR